MSGYNDHNSGDPMSELQGQEQGRQLNLQGQGQLQGQSQSEAQTAAQAVARSVDSGNDNENGNADFDPSGNLNGNDNSDSNSQSNATSNVDHNTSGIDNTANSTVNVSVDLSASDFKPHLDASINVDHDDGIAFSMPSEVARYVNGDGNNAISNLDHVNNLVSGGGYDMVHDPSGHGYGRRECSDHAGRIHAEHRDGSEHPVQLRELQRRGPRLDHDGWQRDEAWWSRLS